MLGCQACGKGAPERNSGEAGQPTVSTGTELPQRATLLRDRVTKDMRALVLGVDERSIFGGHLGPDDHVDILGTFVELEEGDRIETITLLQHVTVLAADGPRGTRSDDPPEHSGRDRRQTGGVTVLVTPQEAEMLVFAQEHGTLALTLRAEGDLGAEEVFGKSAADLRSLNAPRRRKHPPRGKFIPTTSPNARRR